MDWMDQLSGVLQQYTGAAAAPARSNVQDDFDQIAHSAPPAEIADGPGCRVSLRQDTRLRTDGRPAIQQL